MRRPTTLLVATVGLCVLLAGGRARAQRGVDSELFRPALDGYGIFTVERAQTAPQWDFGFKLYVDYAQNPLRLGLCADAASCAVRDGVRPAATPMMSFAAALHFGMHLGLTNWLELVAELPISAERYTSAYGTNGSAGDPTLARTGFYANGQGGYTNVAPPNASQLDWRVGFKARLFRARTFGIAVAGVVTAPFGDDSAFLGDSGVTFRPTLIADVTHGPLTVAINLGAIVRSETVVLAPNDPATTNAGAPVAPRSLIDVGHELTWSAGVAYRFVQWADLGAEVFGLVPLVQSAVGPLDAPRDFTADVLGGFHFFPHKDVAVGVGAGAGLLGSARHDDFRVFAGLSWSRSAAKSGSAGGAGTDSDGDGIPDDVDQCPTAAEDRDGFDDEDGCPDLDNDGDGIPDKLDRCPNEAEDRDGFQDDDGCPEPDNDGDGIADAQDRCPFEPEDRDGFQDDDGCPDLDNDGDGIADAVDKCPNEPETRNGIDDDDGCPDSGGQVIIAGGKIALPDNVLFETGTARLAGRSEALLEHVAAKLTANPQVRRVRIEGHTDDNVAGAQRNLELSQARATVVRDFLVRHGVEPDRLQAVGYGNARPLDPHKTPDARAKNRRVEFIIVEQ